MWEQFIYLFRPVRTAKIAIRNNQSIQTDLKKENVLSPSREMCIPAVESRRRGCNDKILVKIMEREARQIVPSAASWRTWLPYNSKMTEEWWMATALIPLIFLFFCEMSKLGPKITIQFRLFNACFLEKTFVKNDLNCRLLSSLNWVLIERKHLHVWLKLIFAPKVKKIFSWRSTFTKPVLYYSSVVSSPTFLFFQRQDDAVTLYLG